jgi:hypothetical protein
MTVQEIGSYIRFGFKPIIFVVNNNGYSIERAIHGEKQGYNDISMLWDHQKMLEFMGARKETGIQSRSFACKTVEELEKVLNDPDFGSANCIQVRTPSGEFVGGTKLTFISYVRSSWTRRITPGDCLLRSQFPERRWLRPCKQSKGRIDSI